MQMIIVLSLLIKMKIIVLLLTHLIFSHFLDSQIYFKNIIFNICNKTTESCEIIYIFKYTSIII